MINLKRACRTLFKTPFVTVVAILSLALGIGANAAIYSLFNQMLLRPLPVSQPSHSFRAPSIRSNDETSEQVSANESPALNASSRSVTEGSDGGF